MADGLRVLVADEDREQLEPVGDALRELGHDVIALAVGLGETARATHEHRPDLAIVALHEDKEHALELIEQIVEEATCRSACWRGGRAAGACRRRRGAACSRISTRPIRPSWPAASTSPSSAFASSATCSARFDRRARIERAKGLLMERHGISAEEAFERLRRQARNTRTPIMGVVEDVLG